MMNAMHLIETKAMDQVGPHKNPLSRIKLMNDCVKQFNKVSGELVQSLSDNAETCDVGLVEGKSVSKICVKRSQSIVRGQPPKQPNIDGEHRNVRIKKAKASVKQVSRELKTSERRSNRKRREPGRYSNETFDSKATPSPHKKAKGETPPLRKKMYRKKKGSCDNSSSLIPGAEIKCGERVEVWFATMCAKKWYTGRITDILEKEALQEVDI